MSTDVWIPVIVGSILPTIAILVKYWVDAAYRTGNEMKQEATKIELQKAQAETKNAVVILERQINSNLDKQIKASIGQALAEQKLQFQEERERGIAAAVVAATATAAAATAAAATAAAAKAAEKAAMEKKKEDK